MDNIRNLNSRETQIISGAVYEYLDHKFPRQPKGAKGRMSQEITEDIINNFKFNVELDGVREAQNPTKTLKPGIKLPKAWKTKQKS